MKKFLLLTLIIIGILSANATIVTITTVGNKFSPDSVVVRWGDTIQYTNMAGHIAYEVSSTTYTNRTKAALSGGFNSVTSSNQIKGLALGLHYFIDSQYIATDTMRGRIWVLPRVNPLFDCYDFMITEYIEGSGNNKAIELYNPYSFAQTLSGYSLLMYANGALVPTNSTALAATSVSPGGTYVLTHTNASAGILAKGNVNNSTSMNFNGNDAIALIYNNTIVDIFGEIGQNPGLYWVINGTDSSKDMTFVRKPSVNKGNPNWVSSSANDWITFPRDTFFNLGMHTMTPCAGPTPSIVSFDKITDTVVEGIGSKSIALKISNPSSLTASTVQVAIKVGGTASAADYTFTTQTVTFPVSTSANQTFNFTIANDLLIESTENVILKIITPGGAASIGADSIMNLYITDNDTLKATFVATTSTVLESSGSKTIGVKLTAISSNSTTVKINMPTGTATSGSDYSFVSDSLVFPAGDTTTKFYTANIVNDIIVEFTETIGLTLNATNGCLTAGQSHTLSITDNDTLKAILTTVTQTLSEAVGTFSIGVKLNAFSTSSTNVSLDSLFGTATITSDFTITSNTVTFAAMDTATKFFTGTIVNDLLVEPTEDFNYTLSATNGANTIGQIAKVNITDNDQNPILTFTSIASTVSEAVGIHTFSVKLKYPSANATSVSYIVTGGNASGTDYTIGTSTVTFPANDTTPKNFSINIVNDLLVESTETIVIKMASLTNSATLGTDSVYTISITDNDLNPELNFTVKNVTVTEGSGLHTFYVKLKNPSPNPTSVNYSVILGSTTGSDFTVGTSSVTFAANDTTPKNFTITIVDDAIVESTEDIIIKLTNMTNGATLGLDSIYTINITDNDFNPEMNFVATSATVSEAVGTHTFSVKLKNSSPNSTTVSYSVTGGTANGSDYTLGTATVVFPTNDTTPKNFTINITNDNMVEALETIKCTFLSMNNNATKGKDSVYTISITDNDTLKAIYLTSSNSVNENVGKAKVGVKLINQSPNPTTLNINIPTGTATFGSDYSSDTPTIVFGPFDTTTRYFSANIIDDNIIEGNETLIVDMVGDNGCLTTGQVHTLTIIDNDISQFNFTTKSVTKIEGSGTNIFKVNINKSNPTPSSVMITLGVGSTASATSDYTFSSTTVALAANDTVSKDFTVTLPDDIIIEGNETVILKLSNPTGGVLLGPDSIFTLTIQDNDVLKAMIVAATKNVNENVGTITIPVKLSAKHPSSTNVTVGPKVVATNAANLPLDFTIPTTTITIPANDTGIYMVNVNIVDDNIFENTEVASIEIKSVTNSALIDTMPYVINILDNDSTKVVFTTNVASYSEAAGTVQVGVKLVGNNANPIQVTGIFNSGSATLNTDFVAGASIVNFAAMDASTQYITVNITEDAIIESNETFNITLIATNGALTSGQIFNATIIDNETTPTISFVLSSSTVNEFTTLHKVKVKLSSPNMNPTSVSIQSLGGSANSIFDYVLGTTNVTFPALDSTPQDVNITIVNDIVAELNESMTLKLINNTNNSRLGMDSTHIVNIIDNDTLKIKFAKVSSSQKENISTAKIAVMIENMSNNSTTVNLSKTGTATAADYSSTPSTISWGPMDTATKIIDVTVVNDAIIESNETVIFSLTSATNNAKILPGIHTFTIIDEDSVSSIYNVEISLSMYPNPTSSLLKYTTSEIVHSVSIKSITGQTLLENTMNSIEGEVDLSSLNNGTYLVEFKIGNQVVLKKLIIE
jgi:hypothetical protein